MDINDLITKLEDVQKSCKMQSNRNKLGAIRRNVSSLKDFLNKMSEISFILNSEKEVEWFYNRFKELKKDIKR